MIRAFSIVIFTAVVLVSAGCSTSAMRLRQNAAAVAQLDPATRAKVKHGVVEPGFTPEMVYLALGSPTIPAGAHPGGMRDGEWVYRDFHSDDRDYVRAGFRRRVVFDPVRRSDVIITEPVDPRLFPQLQQHELRVVFHDGRVIEVQRAAL